MSKEFKHQIKVYYEDTDMGGVVYYANYLKFLERARTEALKLIGLSNKLLLDNHDALIIVKSCRIDYKKSAKLEDELLILSKVKSSTKTSFIMRQVITLEEKIISEAEVHLVVIDREGKPKKIPNVLEKLLN